MTNSAIKDNKFYVDGRIYSLPQLPISSSVIQTKQVHLGAAYVAHGCYPLGKFGVFESTIVRKRFCIICSRFISDPGYALEILTNSNK